MSLRQKHKVWVNTSRNTGMTDLVYGPGETDRLVEHDSFDQWDGSKIDLAESANVDLNLQGIINCKGIYIQMNGDAKVTINGSDTPLQLRRYGSTTGVVCKLFVEADITSVNVENPSGSGAAMAGHFHAWGSSS